MILLADVNVSIHVVTRLRDSGLRVVRVGEVLDIRASDEEIVGEAERLGAVVVSHDQDFSAILATSGARKPSHINLRTSAVDAAVLAAQIIGVTTGLGEELDRGAIVTIDDGGVRVHLLPIG